MNPQRLLIRREPAIRFAPGRGITVGYHWSVREHRPQHPATPTGHRISIGGPQLAKFPTFEEARLFAAGWVDAHAATRATEPTC